MIRRSCADGSSTQSSATGLHRTTLPCLPFNAEHQKRRGCECDDGMSCSVVTTDLAELAEPRQGNGHGEHVFPAEAPSPTGVTKERLITAVLILAPMLGVVVAALGIWTPRVTLLDIILATLFFVVSGHGLTAGFHRMFTHRSFKATRWLKVTLAIAGSLGVQGSLISWVANHRRHHAYTDTSGD